jgi:hypothetical protein
LGVIQTSGSVPCRSWQPDGFLNSAANPNIPTIGEAMRDALTATEQERLGAWRMATVS